MQLLPAIALTLILLFATGMLSATLRFPVVLFLPPVSAIWAAIDSSRIRQRITTDPSFVPTPEMAALLQTTRPFVAFAACLLLWIFGFPWYLVMRQKLILAARPVKPEDKNAAAYEGSSGKD